MSHKKKYPVSKGWLHATLTMKTSEPINPEQIKDLLTWGNPDSHEFPVIEQTGRRVTAVLRKKTQPAVDA